MDALTTLTVALAAGSALLSAVSTIAAWRATRAVQRDLEHTIAAKRHEIVRAFEQDYAAQYKEIWDDLGPWPDAVPVDPQLRRTVHSLLQTLASVYLALQSGLIEAGQAEGLYMVMFDWLSTDKAFEVWAAVFQNQVGSWPSGFVNFVNSRLMSRREVSQGVTHQTAITKTMDGNSPAMGDREPSVRNDAAAWSDFDADEYWKINYSSVLPEDAEIIRCASKFLIEACGPPSRSKRAVDVGAGGNLYPALLMLPWAEHIVFTEYASPSITWLAENLADAPGEWQWQPFWDLIADRSGYRGVEQPRRRLAAVHEIRTVSIFDLPPRTWDLGSMFFVASSMTNDEAEFELAVRSFLDSLKPGSPFMMAFMEGSSGYDVHGVRFPAVRVTPDSLDALLATLPVMGTRVLRTDNSIRRVRHGYDAMLLVTGFVTS